MIDPKCSICKDPDRRRLIELGWNAKMTTQAMSAVLGRPGPDAILKHLKDHAEDGAIRAIPVEDGKPLRARVYAIQKLQVEEIERRVALAQQRAAEWNEAEDDKRDWSYYFDILDKDMQQAVASIIKAQGMKDKHESTEKVLKIDLFRALTSAGAPPAGLIGPGGDGD